PLTTALARVDELVEKRNAKGWVRTSPRKFRSVMRDVGKAVSIAYQNIGKFFHARSAVLEKHGIQLDEMFLDQFMKQTPLHYLKAISEGGERAGLKEIISDRVVENVRGMTTLNDIGPVVFPNLVFSPDAEDLEKSDVPDDAAVVLYRMDKMADKSIAAGAHD